MRPRWIRCPAVRLTLFAAAAALALILSACGRKASQSPHVSFDGRFQHGVIDWRRTGGGPQCANYGTPSKPPRLRGNLTLVRVKGIPAARFDLPPARLPSFPLEACEIIVKRPLRLGTDGYYGYMVYVPSRWSTQAQSFWGITVAQFHFQNIWAAPIVFELHNTHMTLALETGACHSYLTSRPGCRWRSNADNPDGRPGNLGAHYVLPPPMRRGVWQQIILHVRWSAGRNGMIQIWHRDEGTSDWTRSVNLHGYPTVQWDLAIGCCRQVAFDKIGAYRGLARYPVSVRESNFVIGTSFGAVARALP